MQVGFLAACVSVLVSSASFGGGQATAPVPIDPASWISYEDYPTSTIKAGEHGTVGYRISVREDGSVLSCIVMSSSGVPALDQQTCTSLTHRARFTPANDQAGRPRAGEYDGKVVWTVPQAATEGTPTISMRVMFTTVLDADGGLARCGLVMQSRENPPPTQVCRSMRETAMRSGIAHRGDAPNGVVLINETTTEFNGKPVEGRAAEGLTEIGRRTVRFYVDATGHAVDCHEQTSGEVFLKSRSPCSGDMRYRTLDGTAVEMEGVLIDRAGWRRLLNADDV
ncbi:energy transducer TonB [Sphingomonas sp. NFX23]|uniref:energy transducer TonB n=1 Tax=Sphingomonas sp. NFX23 TaxID=2819532 RepID=UPI003CEC7159